MSCSECLWQTFFFLSLISFVTFEIQTAANLFKHFFSWLFDLLTFICKYIFHLRVQWPSVSCEYCRCVRMEHRNRWLKCGLCFESAIVSVTYFHMSKNITHVTYEHCPDDVDDGAAIFPPIVEQLVVQLQQQIGKWGRGLSWYNPCPTALPP